MKWLERFGLAILVIVLLVMIVALVGLALPQNHVASRTVTLNRPVLDVWHAINDVESFPSWRPSVARVEVLAREPKRWREVGPGDALTLEVVETQAPSRVVVVIADRNLPFGGRWVYDLAPEGAGTRVTITEHGEVYNPIFRFVSRFIIGHTATIDEYLAALQKKLRPQDSVGPGS